MERTEQARYSRHRASVKASRTRARQLANEWGLADLVDDLVLVVDELVTNAIIHATTANGREVSVSYHLDAVRLRVEVRDTGDGVPAPASPARATRTTGEGSSSSTY
ncbi:ATP-binding protein [Streptomyces sp. NPDC050610]|uniref:ATP-binding protein n=1 Tax=Streptomyces sp. NPDC050610 TaxID=3157097 RepID=UPI00341DC0CB